MQNFSLVSSTSLVPNKRLGWVIITAVIIAASIALYKFNPGTINLFPSNPFLELTGIFCAGCGTFRGLHQLLHGNLGAAFGLNALMVLCLPFMFYAYVSYTMEVFFGRSLNRAFFKRD